jgi:hypothetical protein
VQHRRQVAALLLVAAVGDDRRAEHADADDVEDAGDARLADLLLGDDLLDRPESLAADLGRPGHPGQASLGELALPRAAGVEVLALHQPGARRCLLLVLVEPGAHALAVLGLLGGVVEVHVAPSAD